MHNHTIHHINGQPPLRSLSPNQIATFPQQSNPTPYHNLNRNFTAQRTPHFGPSLSPNPRPGLQTVPSYSRISHSATKPIPANLKNYPNEHATFGRNLINNPQMMRQPTPIINKPAPMQYINRPIIPAGPTHHNRMAPFAHCNYAPHLIPAGPVYSSYIPIQREQRAVPRRPPSPEFDSTIEEEEIYCVVC